MSRQPSWHCKSTFSDNGSQAFLCTILPKNRYFFKNRKIFRHFAALLYIHYFPSPITMRLMFNVSSMKNSAGTQCIRYVETQNFTSLGQHFGNA